MRSVSVCHTPQRCRALIALKYGPWQTFNLHCLHEASSDSLVLKMPPLYCATIILSLSSFLVFNPAQAIATSSSVVGSPWSGNMHPQNGFPPSCNISRPNSCAPSYADLLRARQLWPCPSGSATPETCGGGGHCALGEGGLCSNLSSASPCCCPKVGCRYLNSKHVSRPSHVVRCFFMAMIHAISVACACS